MDRTETLGRLQNLFREFFDDANIDLNEQSSGEDILDWDSLAHVRLILTVEKEFDCRFESEEIADLTNVGDLISAILSKQSKVSS